jgi:uncharacterized membrane protein
MNQPETMEDADPATGSNSAIVRATNGVVIFVARHWLAIFNTLWGLYAFLPFVAPFFLAIGWDAPARVIYALYSFTCHQLPSHSYFLFGSANTPNEFQLAAAGMPVTPNLFVQRTFVGNESIGYKVALCERDIAIYGAVCAAGVAYAFVRDRLSPVSLKIFILLAIPMAIDGVTQLFGWRESNWVLRTVTGAMFGAAAVWWAYPYINAAMDDVIKTEEQRHSVSPSG